MALLVVATAAAAQDDKGPPSAEPVSPDSADRIRATLERPPSEPPFDTYDAIGLPFRVLFYPVILVGKGTAEGMGFVAKLARPRETSIFDRLADLGIHPGFGKIGPRSGGAARLRYTGLGPLYLETAFSIRQSQRHMVGLELEGAGRHLDASYRFERHAQPHFWGIGPDSPEAETDYRWDRQIVTVAGAADLAPFELVGSVNYEDNRVARGLDDEEPDLQETNLADGLFGLSERTEYVVFSVGASLDATNLVGDLQRRGILLEAGSDLYLGVDGTDSDFHRFSGAVNGYLPLNLLQSLALRGIIEVNREDGGQGVPFTHLASLGGDRGARAFNTNRFRDRAMIALMSEWRYEVWRELHERGRAETFFLFDAGTVAGSLSDARLDEAETSVGFGLRFIWGGEAVWLSYLAFGSEGARFDMDFSYMF